MNDKERKQLIEELLYTNNPWDRYKLLLEMICNELIIEHKKEVDRHELFN